jgi:tryptophanase
MRRAKRLNVFLDFLTDSGVSAASTRQLSDMMGMSMENAYEDEEHMF